MGNEHPEKVLGNLIDCRLDCGRHVTNVTAKSNKIIVILRLSFDHLLNKPVDTVHSLWQPRQKIRVKHVIRPERNAEQPYLNLYFSVGYV